MNTKLLQILGACLAASLTACPSTSNPNQPIITDPNPPVVKQDVAGTVVDARGNPVARVPVVINDQAKVLTNLKGEFVVPNVGTGAYTVMVAVSGGIIPAASSTAVSIFEDVLDRTPVLQLLNTTNTRGANESDTERMPSAGCGGHSNRARKPGHRYG
jgi:Carboxypeptidase regulatory-like domain